MESFFQILIGVLLSGLIALNIALIKIVLNLFNKTKDRLTFVETKVDIYLDAQGLDLNKVNGAIKQHKEELEQNGRPSVGCINVKSLYKEEYANNIK